MEITEFEVGKFYGVQIYPSYGERGKRVAAMAVRKTKTKIVFEYITRSYEGAVIKCKVERRLIRAEQTQKGIEEARPCGKWSGISSTDAREVCGKPTIWDSVPDAEERH